ncbi:MAG: hypothetical protein AAGA66_03585 [Bacteroidota bacterium]
MKRSIILLVPFVLSAFTQCGNDDIQIPDTPLEGMVAGEEWTFQYGNAYVNPNGIYTIQFLSTEETATDPCAVPSPGNPFVSMAIPLQRMSSSVPFFNLDESPRFNISRGNSFIATSGILEIFDVDNTRVFGFLEAQLDDENTVRGQFQVQICN